ncbi:hypothetical protein ACPW96_22860 [Micromonospora sp. DT81.3]|uniref:hypothetical protein n=1 Tax=Micromonospora sp. DT81.3 TaxID=3416523 RepID=UPI003CF650AA
MLKPKSVLRRMAAVAALSGILMAGAIVGAPSASAQVPECVTGGFTADPAPGSKVKSGKIIVYTVTVGVIGGEAAGCLRDIVTSPLLEFVSMEPEGTFFPPMASILWTGPFQLGTVLQGSLTMQVRCDAPDGAVIEAFSGSTIQHVVKAKKHCTS